VVSRSKDEIAFMSVQGLLGLSNNQTSVTALLSQTADEAAAGATFDSCVLTGNTKSIEKGDREDYKNKYNECTTEHSYRLRRFQDLFCSG
jgi:hypothetical protein